MKKKERVGEKQDDDDNDNDDNCEHERTENKGGSLNTNKQTKSRNKLNVFK